MYHPVMAQQQAPVVRTPTACKQEGCPCKDARVLSYRMLSLVRFMAEGRGQTLDRVVPAGELAGLFAPANEPEKVKSEDTRSGTRCGCGKCDGRCDGIRTIAYPVACHACTRDNHA